MTLVPLDSSLVPQQPTASANVAGPVTLRDELALWQDAFEFAKAIASTDLVPKDARNNPPAVMARIIKGHELGIPALQSLSAIFTIDGRPGMYAELMRALIQARGHELWTEDFTQSMVVLCGRRRDGDHVQKVTWTLDDAKRAGLAGKPVWRAYPRAMLLARATGELARLMFADVLAGMSYTVEELSDGIEELKALEPAADQAGAKPATTRRTTRAAKPAPARTGKTAQGPSGSSVHEPGGPPPPLPGEEDDAFSGAGNGSGHDSLPEPAAEPEQPAEPAEVVTKRAQAIAMRAQKAGVDHHHVIAAVTRGNKTSAKDLTAPEADAVLHALVDIKAGRLELTEATGTDNEGWLLIEPSKVADYQRRIRELRDQRAELDRGGQQTLENQEE